MSLSHVCLDTLRIRDGVTSLDQLLHPGGQSVLPLPMPLPVNTFVMRKQLWDFFENIVFETEGPRMLVITGIGGCGKTQLALKFMRLHESRFTSCFVIDGSSELQIRADTIRHVRSLGIEHSQKSFDECLRYLTQSSLNGQRVILYDNVDDPNIDLFSLLPEGDGCIILITSRNRSLGELALDAHLELDVMSMDEAVELLLLSPNRPTMPTETVTKEASAIAETLGCLPIALQQARSYMFQTSSSLSAYLQRLVDNRDKLLAQLLKNQRNMRYLSTYAAFEASFSKLSQRDQDFFCLLSFFHWSRIPLDLISLAAKHTFLFTEISTFHTETNLWLEMRF